MQRFILLIIAATTIGLLHLEKVSSFGLAPQRQTQTISRRHVLDSLVGFSGVSVLALVAPPADAATADEQAAVNNNSSNSNSNSNSNIETPEDKKARLLKERIAASKKNYRKADNYAFERFTTVDYSCVADTGSPCKEPKSVFPSDESIARDGKIPDL